MAEIRLTVEEQHSAQALWAKKRQRADVDVPRHEHAEDRGNEDPTRGPAEPSTGGADPVALRVVQAHRLSCVMNCAIGDASFKSSTNRIADFGTSIRDAGPWSSRPRRTIFVSGAAFGSELLVCCR